VRSECPGTWKYHWAMAKLLVCDGASLGTPT
jgi:hypothetical protein